LNLSNPSGATLSRTQATGTIVNPNQMTISDIATVESSSGTTDAVFTVSLASPAAQTLTVDYATADGTATDGTDYAAASGTLTFSPGMTSQTITVSILGDA